MENILLRLAGYYGKSTDNTCETPQPGMLGHMEIQERFVATRGQDRYDLFLIFSSVADKIVFCNSDPAGDPERSFSVYAPLSLQPQFADMILRLGDDLLVTVGAHDASGMIEFFFHGPLPAQ